MAGIYIHIPFCRRACHYCNFHFSTSLHRKPELLEAMKREIDSFLMPPALMNEKQVETLYYGGGTPSILSSAEMEYLFAGIRAKFSLAEGAEITLEANPDDISPEKLEAWKQMGINRLSIGIQSFRDEDLAWMNRAHSARQAFTCIEQANAAGFDNLNIDLIFGTPTLPDEAWHANLEQAEKMSITHLSCYALTVEENTALHHFIKKGKVPPPPEEKQARHFEMLMDWAARSGWEHYEISNLCKPGHHSRHNSNYWTGKPFFGFGPSAHSFDGNATRWMAVANNARYIDAWLTQSGDSYAFEYLTHEQCLNEKIMTGLRRSEGIAVNTNHGMVEGFSLNFSQQKAFQRNLSYFLQDGLCLQNGERITLTPKGRLYADHVAAGLFL